MNNEENNSDNTVPEKMDSSKRKYSPLNIKRVFWFVSSGLRSLSDSIISPFIPLYGQALGATSTQIGFIVSITSLLSIVQLFWAYISQKFRITRAIAIISSYVSSVFSFVLLPIKNIYAFASVRGAHSIVLSATVPTSSSLIAERIPQSSWPLHNSLLQGILVVGTAIGTLVGGIFLWKFSTSLGFVIIFISSGAISILSAMLFHIAIPSQKRLVSKGRWYNIEEVDVTFNNTLAIMKTERNFLLFCIVNFIFVFGVNLSGPFYIIFNTTHYDLTIFETALLTAIGLIPQTISSIITAKFIEKVRKKELLIIAGIFTAFFPVFFMIPSLVGRVSNVFWILIIIWCFNGICWGIVNSSLVVLLLDIIHPRRRALQLAINNSLSAVALFVAPIIGGLVIEKTATIYIILIISAAIRFIGVILFIFVKEPVIGGTILRPIQRLVPYILRSNMERGVSILSQGRTIKRNTMKFKKRKKRNED